MISKNKNLFLKIYIPFVIITIIALVVLQILGSKSRIGYLTDFNLNIERTLELNNLNDIRKDFIVDEKLDEENIKNYLLTNENITNYVHHFRIRYYDKTFRNNDIYGVYPDLSNLPDYMENAEMDGDGSPYGNFISDKKEIEEDKIDNINYILKVKNNLVKILLIILTGILLTITLLLRHNAIVTIYPIFILFTYLILEKSISNAKLYLLKFMTIMLFFSIILLSIVKFTPRIFLTKEQAVINGANPVFAFNIGGIAYTSGDYSLIPKEWYLEGKNSEDLMEAYQYGYINNKSSFTEGETFFKVLSINIRNSSGGDIKKVFKKYIFKHPISYIKFISMVGKCLWFYDFELKKDFLSIEGIQSINTPPGNNNFKVSKKYNLSEQRIQFSDFRLKIYTFLYNISLNINNIIPISICIIIFFLSGLLWLLKNNFRNKLLLFTFCIAFSGFATALIVIMFSPSGRTIESRYIAPVLPISIISLISFLTFIYDRGGFKKFFKELRGEKK